MYWIVLFIALVITNSAHAESWVTKFVGPDNKIYELELPHSGISDVLITGWKCRIATRPEIGKSAMSCVSDLGRILNFAGTRYMATRCVRGGPQFIEWDNHPTSDAIALKTPTSESCG